MPSRIIMNNLEVSRQGFKGSKNIQIIIWT